MIEALEEAAHRSGYVLDWRDIAMPELNMLEANNEALRRGDVDLLAGLKTPERRREFLVTEPWWSVGLAALVRADSAIREESDLRGKRLAVTPGVASLAESTYAAATIEPRDGPVLGAEAVCLGDADAALTEEIFMRETLLRLPPPCHNTNLRVMDCRAHLDFVLVFREDTASAARALKSALDDLTADGTLAIIAARHAPFSAPYAAQLAEAARLRFARRTWAIGMAAALALALLGGGFTLKLSHSRRRLRDANRRLQVDLDARIKAEAALRDSEARFRALFDSAPQSVFAIDRTGTIVFANRRSEGMFGQAPEQLIGRNLEALLPLRLRAAFRKDHLEGVREAFGLHAGGEEFPIEVALGPVETSEGLTLAFVSDISERVALQAQLLQWQKLESVGHLAGGVAHDFNNMLFAIEGYAGILHRRMPPDDPLRSNVEHILEASERAAQVTRGLLAFSRKQVMTLSPFRPNELVARMERFLRRIIGEDIELRTVLGPDAPVLGDAGQIEQVLMNLATNARDAMPRGGLLTIETGLREVAVKLAVGDETREPGTYAWISATDSGTGIDEFTMKRVFEPFFTTKGIGCGTGLGLAIAYGVVRQHRGFIEVNSEVGKGTTFTVHLPAQVAGDEAGTAVESTPLVGGRETILLAEDDASVRDLMEKVLAEVGYRVITARDGVEAVAEFLAHEGEIDLCLLDVVMPKKGGREAYEEIRRRRPDVKVVFTSGYTEERVRQEQLPGGSAFIQKPSSPHRILATVRRTLDAA